MFLITYSYLRLLFLLSQLAPLVLQLVEHEGVGLAGEDEAGLTAHLQRGRRRGRSGRRLRGRHGGVRGGLTGPAAQVVEVLGGGAAAHGATEAAGEPAAAAGGQGGAAAVAAGVAHAGYPAVLLVSVPVAVSKDAVPLYGHGVGGHGVHGVPGATSTELHHLGLLGYVDDMDCSGKARSVKTGMDTAVARQARATAIMMRPSRKV